MDEDDFCYLFDTFGHVVLPNVLGADELATLNAAVDRHLDDDAGWFEYLYEDGTTGYAPADRATPLAGSMGYSIGKDAPSMLSWPEPRDRDPFRKLMHHPELCRSMNALCGRGFRLDHPPSLRIYNPRPAGAAVSDDAPLNLHGSSGPDFNPHEYYVVRNGRMHSGLTVVAWQLADIGPGDGGFGLIPGSHKGNFPCPPAMRRGEAFREHVHQPVCKAGDCVIFTEALTHTTLPWRGEHQRRSLLVRYAPANLASLLRSNSRIQSACHMPLGF
jgi:hypothetical protein